MTQLKSKPQPLEVINTICSSRSKLALHICPPPPLPDPTPSEASSHTPSSASHHVSHVRSVWSTGQDQMRVVKQRLLEMVPNLRIFLDVDDLKEGRGELDVDRFCLLNENSHHRSLPSCLRNHHIKANGSLSTAHPSTRSQTILCFMSRGYFKSKNCQREASRTSSFEHQRTNSAHAISSTPLF